MRPEEVTRPSRFEQVSLLFQRMHSTLFDGLKKTGDSSRVGDAMRRCAHFGFGWSGGSRSLGGANSVLVELVGKGAAGQPHAAGGFGLRSASGIQGAQYQFLLRFFQHSSQIK